MKKAYNLLILDASGSMQSIREATISGFNELIQGIRAEAEKDPELQQFIQFFSFNANGIRELIPLQPAKDLPQLSPDNYQPDAMTPLFDAIGHAVGKLRIALEGERDYAVLVTILTDGAENASREYTRQTIANIIKKLEQENWVFTFMGTNQDVHAEAAKISVTNYMKFDYHAAGTSDALKQEMHYRARFYGDLKAGRMDEAKKGFYRNENGKADAADEDHA
jgi:uncharacterized protein YegL